MGRKIGLALAALLAGVLIAGTAATALAQQQGKGKGKTEPAKKQDKEKPAPPKQASGGPEEVVYSKVDNSELKLYFHYPSGWKAGDRRGTILFLGGGWDKADLDQFKDMADYFASRGAVAVRVDYRTAEDFGTKAEACVEDVRNAIAFLRKNASKFGVNPAKIAVVGEYAAGLIAASSYLAPPAKPDPQINNKRPTALVLINPILDARWFINKFSSVKDAQRNSPIHNLRGGLPPTLLIAGTNVGGQGGSIMQQMYSLMQMTGAFQPGAPGGGFPPGGAPPGAFPGGQPQRKSNLDIMLAVNQRYLFYKDSPWKEATYHAIDRFLVRNRFIVGRPSVKLAKGAKLMTMQEMMQGEPEPTQPNLPNLGNPDIGQIPGQKPGQKPPGIPNLPPGFKKGDPLPPGVNPGGNPSGVAPPGIPSLPPGFKKGDPLPPGVAPGGNPGGAVPPGIGGIPGAPGGIPGAPPRRGGGSPTPPGL